MRVGIIGGGISGLATARGLLKYGIECVVFDTGKRGVGGRCSSRSGAASGFPGAVDHAAQFVEVSGECEAFGAFVDECAGDGTLQEWSGYEGGAGRRLFVGSSSEGIGALSSALARGLDVRQDVWVSPNGGVRFDRESRQWLADRERFDAIVIAHNGKCAERITSKIPSAAVRNLCRAAFGTKPAKGRMTLNSVYSLVFEARTGALGGGDDAPVARKFEGDAALAFLGNNGRKLGWATDSDATEVFTVLSTGEYGKKNKHPQEQLAGTDVERRVTRELLDAVAAACGAAPLEPKRSKLQLWGAALPLNKWVSDAPFAWDGTHRIGVVGDWLDSALPSCVEAAFASGDGLAAHLRDAPGDDKGLVGAFADATSDFSAPRPRSPAAAAAAPPRPSTKTPEEKRVVKLKKALKRIGQLRREDYAQLKTDQRVKIHGEADVLDELTALGVDAEALRAKLQPGLGPMPRSKPWSKERDAAREREKADGRRRDAARPGPPPRRN